MKLFISICAFVFFMLSAQVGFSQREIEVSGKKYLLHEVKKGETTFGLCQIYKISQAELKAANPDQPAVLKSGSTIKIPVKDELSATGPVPPTVKKGAVDPGFYPHTVTKNQTLFSIARQYNITANELIKYNPTLTNGLIPGTVLKIPAKVEEAFVASANAKSMVESSSKVVTENKSEENFITHSVVAGETLYGLENKFGVTREELISHNPSLTNGLQAGTKIKIPVNETKASVPNESLATVKQTSGVLAEVGKKDDSTECKPIVGKNDQNYKVALLLPFYLQGNEQVQPSNLNEESVLSPIELGKITNQWYTGSADSVVPSNAVAIDPKADSFLEFYEGALLAVDSLQRQGMNVEIYVFDASNLNMINSLLQLDVFRELDLIIGPVYPELQETVASFAAKNRIPMVSPLANTGNFEEHNPFYIKVNPSKEYQVEQTANYIADNFSDKNFVLLKMDAGSNSTEAKVAELGRERLLAAKGLKNGNNNLFHEYSFQHQGLHDVKSVLDETGENIFMIPSDNEAQVSVAVTNLNALAEQYNVVLMGTSNFPKLKSIQTENYHRIRLRYLSSTFVDYNKPLVKHFILNYRNNYSTEPTQFSYQGFDVSYYFLSALYHYGKNFKNCLSEYPMELTQTNFNIGKVNPMGGYMNHSLFVTAFERNFEIMNLGTVGSEPR